MIMGGRRLRRSVSTLPLAQFMPYIAARLNALSKLHKPFSPIIRNLVLQLLETVGEVRYGTYQGQELGKLAQRRLWRTIQLAPSRVRFPDGEAMRDVQMRAVNALEDLCEKHPRSTVAVVSHSDVIKMIVAHYLGMHLDLFQRINVSPASLTVLSLGAGHAMIEQVNETSYLPKEEPPKPDEGEAKPDEAGREKHDDPQQAAETPAGGDDVSDKR